MPGVRTLAGPMDCRFPPFCKAHLEWVAKALAHPSKTLEDERHSVAPEYRVVIWFKKRGFRNDDSLGEELSKRLLGFGHDSDAEQDDSESDEEVVRCRGTTSTGTRCQLTDERGPEGWYYKARPLCEGSHYCGQFAKPIKTPKALIRRLAPRVSGIMLVRPPLSLNLADTEINRRSMTIYSREYMWSVAHILTTVRIYFYN